MEKQAFLEQVKTSRDRLEQLVNNIPQEWLNRPGAAGNWTVKDVLCHITWHEHEMIRVLTQRALVGSELWNLPLHERNQAIYTGCQELTLEDTLLDFRATFPLLWELLKSVTEEELNDPNKYREMPGDWEPWKLVAENTFEHYDDHIPDLERWLTEQR